MNTVRGNIERELKERGVDPETEFRRLNAALQKEIERYKNMSVPELLALINKYMDISIRYEMYSTEGEKWLLGEIRSVQSRLSTVTDRIQLKLSLIEAKKLVSRCNINIKEDVDYKVDHDTLYIRACLQIADIASEIEAYLNERLKKDDTERNGISDGATTNLLVLPPGLNTPKAKALLEKLITAGLCDDQYRWQKSKALLAYFAEKASDYLKLGKGEDENGRVRTAWKPFETLFRIKRGPDKWENAKNLSGARGDYKKYDGLPKDYELINKLFVKH